MPKLDQPLFGDEARGTIARAIIYKAGPHWPSLQGHAWHGQNWTTEKRQWAATWKTLCDHWRALTDDQRQQWKDLAPGVLTGFNYFMKLAGQIPWPPPYEPPAGDQIHFDFITTPYTPPPGDAITFNLGDWPQ